MDTQTTTLKASGQPLMTLKTLLGVVILWGLLICMGWAAEGLQTPAETTQATLSADKTQSNAPTAQVQSEEPKDFLADNSPLSKPTVSEDAATNPQTEPTDVSMVAVEGNGRQCSHTGTSANGSEECISRAPNGSFTESTSNWEDFGDEKKEQTVARHYNSNGDSEGEDTLRIKTEYKTDANGVKQKVRELYDTVNQPPKGLIARDLIVKEYDAQGQLKKTTWAHYVEIGTRKAGLAHHAVLYYEDGKLTSGFANKYKDGKVVDILLNYDPAHNPNLRMEKTGVLKWASWIDGLTQSLLTPIHN